MHHRNGTTNGAIGDACLTCGVHDFERNHFFNGKLLTERDFVAEQDYLRRKDHLHNQLLHGWGTACGLKVTEHPNAACRDEFLRVEPGVAIDCCGKEIVIARERFVAFHDLAARAAEASGMSLAEPKTVHLCLAYDECGVEEVPALFADCTCDDDGTEPNRIREGGRFAVRIASLARPEMRSPVNARLDWRATIQVEKPSAVIADNQLARLYLVAGDDNEGRLDVYDAENHSYENSIDLERLFNAGGDPANPAAALALSLFGDRLFVAAEFPAVEGGAAGPKIRAYLVDALAKDQSPFVDPLPADDPRFVDLTIDQPVAQLLVSPVSGALFALDKTANALMVWDIPTTGNPAPAPASILDLGEGSRQLALTHNGRHLYVARVDAAGQPSLSVRPVATLDVPSETPLDPAEGLPVAIAISYDDRYLYVLSQIDDGAGVFTPSLRRYDIGDPLSPTPSGAPVSFDAGTVAVDLVVAPGDRWAYLYLRETIDAPAAIGERLRRAGAAVVVPYRLAGLEHPEPASGFGKAIEVGTLPLDIYQTFRGERLYAVSADPDDPPENQVAVITVAQEPCDDIFLDAVDGCPGCETIDDDCIVLATIKDYVLGAAVDNAGIDNVTDRRIVPSTTSITDVVKCIIEQGVGEGIPGPRGPVGDRGRGIVDVVVDAVLPPDTDPTVVDLADYDPLTETLTLRLIRGANGTTGRHIEAAVVTFPPDWTEGDPTNATVSVDPATNLLTLFLKLPRGGAATPATRITGMSWIHDEMMGTIDEFVDRMMQPGIVISFDGAIQMATVTRMTFQLWVRHVDRETGLICECYVPVRPDQIFGFEVTQTEIIDDRHVLITAGAPVPNDVPEVKAIAIIFDPAQAEELLGRWHGAELDFDSAGVLLRCDFVLDLNGVAVDGNHIGGAVPTGNGVQGDAFESWVQFRREG